MSSYVILLSIVFLPLVGIVLIYLEQECMSAIFQKRRFKREMAELEVAIAHVRSNYEAFKR
ncbi:MAG TPA: hypothetical protein V6C76_00500 [Drouetiella sp.]